MKIQNGRYPIHRNKYGVVKKEESCGCTSYFLQDGTEEVWGCRGHGSFRFKTAHSVDLDTVPTVEEIEAAEELEAQGVDFQKIRRRVEDRLRKGTDAEILRVARSLGVKLTP